jgi:hypothetical protein
VHQFVVVAEAAKRVSGTATETFLSADLGPLKTELVRARSLAILLLLVLTTLGVFKPWGLISYGESKQQERRRSEVTPRCSLTHTSVKRMVNAEGSNLQPCILLATARFSDCVLIEGQIGFRREADFNLRRCYLAAWTVDTPPAHLSDAVENPRPTGACIHKVGERGCSGSGSRDLV